MSKPREFWIVYFDSGRGQISKSQVTLDDEYFSEPNQTRGIKPKDVIHVIEHSAYAELERQNAIMREALCEYKNGHVAGPGTACNALNEVDSGAK